MTWYFDIADDGSAMDVYDQTGTQVATGYNRPENGEVVYEDMNGNAIASYDRTSGGFRTPADVFDIMRQEVGPELPEKANAGNTGNSYGLSQRGGEILRDMALQDIQEGTPP